MPISTILHEINSATMALVINIPAMTINAISLLFVSMDEN
jgi:hypothetical protein